MRNFRQVVKMMVMAIAMGALFCSCNMVGGSEYYDAAFPKASGISGSVANGPSQTPAFSIKLPSVKVSLSGDDYVFQSETETAVITAEASEGAVLSWYVNGMEQAGQSGTTFELNCAFPGVYDVTCIAISADGKLCRSASTHINVYP